MCGIVYAFRKDGKPARKQVLKRYGKQKERGSDGFGFVALSPELAITDFARAQTEEEIRKALDGVESSHLLFHHRYPTSALNIPETAHPILVRHESLKHDYYVVHNGVLTGHDRLREKHRALGYPYTTEVRTTYKAASRNVYYGDSEYNDSECLAIELARTIEGLQAECEAEGSIAYIALQTTKSGIAENVYYGTNGGNPLCLRNDASGIYLSSTGGERINDHVAYCLHLASGTTSIASVPLRPYHLPAGYGRYAAYTSSGVYDAEEEDFDPTTATASDWSRAERELRREIAAAAELLEVAEQCGEQEEVEELQAQLVSLYDELQAMQIDAYGAAY